MKYQEHLNRADNTFNISKKKDMRLEMTKILERFNKDNNSNDSVDLVEDIVDKNVDSQSPKKDLTIQKELQLQIKQVVSYIAYTTNKIKEGFDKIQKNEMTTFES